MVLTLIIFSLMGVNLTCPPTVSLTSCPQCSQAGGWPWSCPRTKLAGRNGLHPQACGLSIAVLYLSELAHGSQAG